MRNFCDVGTVVLHPLKCPLVKNTDGSANTVMRYWLQNEPRWREVSTKQVWHIIIIPETRWWDPFTRSPHGLMLESLPSSNLFKLLSIPDNMLTGHLYCYSCWQGGHARTEGENGPGIGPQREQRPLQHESSMWAYHPVSPWQRLLWPQHSSVPCLAFPSNNKSDVLVAHVLWPTRFHVSVWCSGPMTCICFLPRAHPEACDSAAGVFCSFIVTNKRLACPMQLLLF